MTKILLLATLLLTTSCSAIGTAALKSLTSSGPSVEAQVGKDNTKVIGISEQVKGDKKTVEAQEIKTVVVQQVPPWVLLLLVLGWLLPSPGEISRKIRGLWKRNG